MSYIPEHLVYKQYKYLNKNSYIEKRLRDYSYKYKNPKIMFDLSYPVTNQLKINSFDFIDKSTWAYSIQKFNKITDIGNNTNRNFNNYYKFKFDNEHVNSQKLYRTYENLAPFYFTNRTSLVLKSISNLVKSNSFSLLGLARLGLRQNTVLMGITIY
jgi:hypothetical protein